MRPKGFAAGLALLLLSGHVLATAEEYYLTESEINGVIGQVSFIWDRTIETGRLCAESQAGSEMACKDFPGMRDHAIKRQDALMSILDSTPGLRTAEIDVEGIRAITASVERASEIQSAISEKSAKPSTTNYFNLAILVVVLFVYFLPGIVASRKGKRNTTAIMILNLFLGWTFIGWVVALVWACMEDDPPPRNENRANEPA